MSLQPQAPGLISEEAERIARAACPKDNRYLQLHDPLSTLSEDESSATLALLTQCWSSVGNDGWMGSATSSIFICC
jgi:hypothetical protein